MNNKTHSKKCDLEKRTAKFGENIIRFCKKPPKNPINIPQIFQLVKAGTSVEVQIHRDEADDAESKQDISDRSFFRSIRN